MLQLLVKFVFFVISSIASLILTPILSVISLIVPDTSTAITNITNFISYGLSAVPFILKLLCVPLEAVSFYFSFFVLIFGISLSVRAFVFLKNIYFQFKP